MQSLIPMNGISEMIDFLSELRNNNNREWFLLHKKDYEDIRDNCFSEINILISEICKFDSSLSGLDAKDCVFRIYRDLRFSKDKSPYKTHFGIVLARGGHKCKTVAAYLHIEPGNCGLYGGAWMPDRNFLKALRMDISDNIEEFIGIVEEKSFLREFGKLQGEALKKIPAGFNEDCPGLDYVKMKQFLAIRPLHDKFFSNAGWEKELANSIKKLHPFLQFLNYIYDNLHT